MRAPIVNLFMSVGEERDAVKERLRALGFRLAGDVGGPSEILLAIGADGGAVLARCIAEQGLDGVRGIGLVGVTAPWAERRERSCEACMIDGAPCNTPSHWDDRRYRPLGPIEPLRSVAEKAMRRRRLIEACAGARCKACEGAQCPCCGVDPVDGYCKFCDNTGHEPLRLILACAPDDVVCAGCGGLGAQRANEVEGFAVKCDVCSGTGNALSSREVAAELCGPLPGPWSANPATFAGTGGVSAQLYPTRAELDAHGLRAVVERLAR